MDTGSRERESSCGRVREGDKCEYGQKWRCDMKMILKFMDYRYSLIIKPSDLLIYFDHVTQKVCAVQCLNYTAAWSLTNIHFYARLLYETSGSSLHCIITNYDDLVVGHISLVQALSLPLPLETCEKSPI